MIKQFSVFLFLLLLATPSCRQSNNVNNQTPIAKPTATATSIVKPNADAKIKTYNGTGIVTKINLEIVSVELKHEEIKGLMPGMQMEFYVRDKSQLETLSVGDRADFVLEDNRGAERIIEIRKQ